jgi:acyl carrier protein
MIKPDLSTRARVVAVIAEILEIDPSVVSGALRLREDLGMDSLGSLELLSTISEQLRLELEMEDAMAIVTVDDACAFVERHRAEGERRANGA